MTNKEAIDTIKHAIAEVEWIYPMDYAAAFDKAVEALELIEKEAVEPDYDPVTLTWSCGNCGQTFDRCKNNFCYKCGKKVKWDEDGQVNQSPAGLGGTDPDAGEVQTADRSRRQT